MALAKRKSRKITFLFICLLWTSSLGAREKVTSLWFLSFNNLPRPVEVALERDLKALPARLLSDWEKKLWAEEPEDLEKLKRQTNKELAISDLDFNSDNSLRSKAFKASYLDATTPSKPPSVIKSPDWAPLAFKVQKNPSLEKNAYAVGSLEFKSSSRTDDDLLVISLTIHQKGKESQTHEFAFTRTTPAQQISLTLRDFLAEDLLAYKWIRLDPTVDPKDAFLTVEGHKLPLKDPKLLFFPEERLPLTLTVWREGFQPKIFPLEIAENFTQSIQLEHMIPKNFEISSAPSGAKLYLDNFYLGETPFQFQAVPLGKILSIHKEGLTPEYLEISKLEEKTFVDLNKNLQNYNVERLSHHRTRYYASFLTLFLSLIPTATFINLDQNAKQLQLMGNPVNRTLTKSLLWTSVSLNVGALIWNIVESILYVQQASKTIKR